MTARVLRSAYGSLLRHSPIRDRHARLIEHLARNHDTPKSLLKDPLHDPYTYTSGRWLRRDEQERQRRGLIFDFTALFKRVVECCPGARSITAYEKMEGGYNRVFLFTCDNEQRIVARLPTSVSGPARLTTNSEVATITYIRSKTKIPIPKILDWSDNPSNDIGSEYIIMEPANGVQLHQRWPTMSGEQQIQCIAKIYHMIQPIVSLDFPAYGSLYFLDAPLLPASKIPIEQEFCIGPHWQHLDAYCNGLIDAGYSCVPPSHSTPGERPSFLGDTDAHIRVLGSGREVVLRLAKDPRVIEAGLPTLYHADLHKRNIFVSDDDPTLVTDIIDWQSSSINPAFEYVDSVPDFALLPNEYQPEDERAQFQAGLCWRAYEASALVYLLKIRAAMMLDADLLRPINICHNTWTNGAVVLRDELLRISGRWHELGLAGDCPYKIPPLTELTQHQKEVKDSRIAEDVKLTLTTRLGISPDGWVPAEIWEPMENLHRQVFEQTLQSIRMSESDEDDLTEQEMRAIWPFDVV